MHGAPGTFIEISMPDGLRYGTDPRLLKTWLTWYGKPGSSNSYHLHHVKPWAYPNPNIWGPETFGGWSLANPDYHTVMTKATIGGVPIDTFLPGAAGWDLMTNNYAITESERLAEGIPDLGEVDVLWWGQGEQLSNPPGNYYNDLTNLISQIKNEFSSPNMKVVFMGLNKRYAATHESDVAFKTYVENNPDDAVYVYTKDLHVRGDSGYEPLNVHYSAKGLKELGYRMASATYYLLTRTNAGAIGICSHTGIHSDNDGVCDYCEDIAGTDRFDLNDFFHINSISNYGGTVELYFNTSSNRHYSAEFTTNIVNGESWFDLGENMIGTGGTNSFSYDSEKGSAYFRLKVEYPD